MMAAGMPELGSKISLISKADIRYEGRLFTVDPQECTIALASVRSFGTEERDTQFPVPAQNQVYDYILFRGSDIKDIRVVNPVTHPQPLNDPAIMQLSVPPSLGGQQFQQHPILGHMAGHPPYGSFLPMGGLTNNAAPGMQPGGSRQGSKPNSVLDFIGQGAASRSTTPASLRSRKSSMDQGTQAGMKPRQDGNKRQMKPIQPPRGQQRNKSRERRDSQGNNQQERGLQYNQGRQQHPQQQQRGRPQQHYQNNQQGGYNQYNRGGWNNQRGMQRGGRGRPKGPPFSGGNNSGQGNKKNTLKFDSEYDFEQANTEFEELRSKLAKVKIDEPSGSAKPEAVNGVVAEIEKKDDSGNETGAGETEQEEDHEVFYDKTKSFFDKISCEAVERAKGKMQRTDWRQERKLNSETFGVAATRRGNYRGRGGYRGGFRGGYRGGYRYQQRRPSDQQQTNQENKQIADVIYCPLTGEEALAEKKEADVVILEESQIEKIETTAGGQTKEVVIISESVTVQDAKKVKEDKTDSSACVGQ